VSDEEKSDDSEPWPGRQAELRAAYDANVAAGKAPYEGVLIRTRGELSWVMRERDWRGEGHKDGKARPDLSGAHFTLAFLRGAYLGLADLRGADFSTADLRGVDLRRTHMNAETNLYGAQLDARTRLADVVWNGVPVTRFNWEEVDTLGDEWVAHQAKDEQGKPKDKARRLGEFQSAVLANRQVATLLRSQGLNEPADRFAYRAQVLQRQVLRRQRQWLRWLWSGLLDAVAGYGYRPLRSVIAYVLIICLFAGAYLLNAQLAAPHLTWDEALVLSISSFHGRGFFTTGISLGDTLARLAAGEAILGLLIEITFIATFTNRFFAR
jgi:uncharacterized protein YjbI with pentapeptide repeats